MNVPEEATVDGQELSPGARDVLETLGERVRNIEEALTWLAGQDDRRAARAVSHRGPVGRGQGQRASSHSS